MVDLRLDKFIGVVSLRFQLLEKILVFIGLRFLLLDRLFIISSFKFQILDRFFDKFYVFLFQRFLFFEKVLLVVVQIFVVKEKVLRFVDQNIQLKNRVVLVMDFIDLIFCQKEWVVLFYEVILQVDEKMLVLELSLWFVSKGLGYMLRVVEKGSVLDFFQIFGKVVVYLEDFW